VTAIGATQSIETTTLILGITFLLAGVTFAIIGLITISRSTTKIGMRTLAGLLRELGYSLQGNRKRLERGH